MNHLVSTACGSASLLDSNPRRSHF